MVKWYWLFDLRWWGCVIAISPQVVHAPKFVRTSCDCLAWTARCHQYPWQRTVNQPIRLAYQEQYVEGGTYIIANQLVCQPKLVFDHVEFIDHKDILA